MTPLNTEKPVRSLCILRLSALGDITHMLPVVRTLLHAWPDCKLTWIIGKTEYQLVEGLQNVEFIIFDKSQGLQAYRNLYRQLSGRRFDVLLHMQAALRASIASLLIRAPIRIGFDRARAADLQWLFSNKKINTPPRQHVLDVFFGFLQAAGLQDRHMVWQAPVPEKAIQFAREIIAADCPTLVLNPCSSVRKNNYRNWRSDRYAAVVDHAIEKLGMQVILTGGPAHNEREMAADICRQSRFTPLNLTGKTSIKQMLAILQLADLVMAPDTGPAHMATAVGTPVIGLYVTSNPFRSGPYNDLESVVNCYPEAVREEFGADVEDIRWGKRVRKPDAVDIITTDAVIRQLDQSVSRITS